MLRHRLPARTGVRLSTLVILAACGGAAPEPSNVGRPAVPPAVATTPTATRPDAPPAVAVPLPADAIVRVPDAQIHPPAESAADLAKLYDAKTDSPARVKALGDIGTKVHSMRGVAEADRGPQLVAYLKTRPDVEAAADIPGFNVWGRFRDGRVFTIETYSQEEKPAPKSSLPHASDLRERAARGAKTYTEGTTPAALDVIRYDLGGSQTYLNWAGDAGYQKKTVTTAGAAEPNNLFRALNEDTALLYVNMHGGSGYERNGADVFSFTTSKMVLDCDGHRVNGWGEGFSPEDIARIATCSDLGVSPAMWAAGEVTYTYAANADDNGDPWEGWHYGVTSRYVRNRFKLKEGAIVYLNVCQAGGRFGGAMRSALLSTGAAAVVAFDDDVQPSKGVRNASFFLARLLGVVDPHDTADGLAPQRPWDLDATMAEAHQRGFDFTTIETRQPAVRANAHVFAAGAAEAMLLPSIKYSEVNEANRLLSIHGDFGKDPGDKGKVTVGGSDCPVKHWTETQVDCDLGGAFFLFGDVVVSSRGRMSNKAPLSAWKFSANSDFELPPNAPGNFDFAWSFVIDMRADIHKYRESKPTDAGRYRDEFDVYAGPGSNCQAQPSGYLRVPGATVKALQIPAVAASSAPTPNGSCVIVGRLDASAKTLKLGIYAQQPPSSASSYSGNGRTAHGLGALPFTLWPEMSDGELAMGFQFQLPPGVTLPPEAAAKLAGAKVPVKSVTLHFDDKWAIVDATKTAKPQGVTATFAVHGVPGLAIPDDKTQQ